MRPPKGRTWGRRGHTPVMRVAGGDAGRVNIAGLLCYRPGDRSRLIYRVHIYHRRKHEQNSFTEADYIQLLDDAHQQLHAPLVLIWDNLNRHTDTRIQPYLARRDWLTVIQLPAYAPDLNPVEGVWSVLKRGLGNLLVRHIDQLDLIIRTRLRAMQHRTDNLLDGFLAETGLTLDSVTP
ncbi:transposase [Nocardia sp. NPDC046763]|uniref:transposase n=1 Tax=Nocardia sp. NPDC046763 TaxID=3155256 RepID=UPI0033E0ECA2